MLLGFLHVALGPDHLSALATLSVGNSYKAFNLGVKWGLGHSTGLVTIAIAFISLKGNLDLKSIANKINYVLGVFMMVLGISGIISAFKSSADMRKKRDKRDGDNRGVVGTGATAAPTSSSVLLTSSSSSNSRHKSSNNNNINDVEKPSNTDHECRGSTSSSTSDDDETHYDGDHLDCCGYIITPATFSTSLDMRDPWTQKIVSFSIGILHGAAGPGAILGVLPAVEMQSWVASSTYLFAFVVSSTLCMGIFAALYGELTKRLGSTADGAELCLRVFSSSCSVVVGALWLVLSFTGKLDEIFH